MIFQYCIKEIASIIIHTIHIARVAKKCILLYLSQSIVIIRCSLSFIARLAKISLVRGFDKIRANIANVSEIRVQPIKASISIYDFIVFIY